MTRTDTAPPPQTTSLIERLVHDPASLAGHRIAVVVAHPDDELLGCGIALSRIENALVIHVTNGAPANGGDSSRLGFASPAAYAAARRRELEAAMALVGVPPENLIGLEVPDQGAAHALIDIAHRLVPLLRGADLVLTHAYEGGHPDHDATAFAVHQAARRLGAGAPILAEMPLYRAAADGGWIRQAFAPEPEAGPEVVLELDAAQQALKARMAAAHASQSAVLDRFSLATERFRRAPPYDFERPHNGGVLLYDHNDWGMTGEDWRRLVRAALAGHRPG